MNEEQKQECPCIDSSKWQMFTDYSMPPSERQKWLTFFCRQCRTLVKQRIIYTRVEE